MLNAEKYKNEIQKLLDRGYDATLNKKKLNKLLLAKKFIAIIVPFVELRIVFMQWKNGL